MELDSLFMFSSVLLTGLLAGIGFLTLLGINPALRETPAKHIILHWQILDDYMRTRMPVFGTLILFSLTGTSIFITLQSYRQPLWFVVAALICILMDIVIAVIYNFPFNRAVQNSTPDFLTVDFEYQRKRSVKGFYMRAICMIGSFVAMLLAMYLQASKGLVQ